MPDIGLIAGTTFLEIPLPGAGQRRSVDTRFGRAVIEPGNRFVFVARHGPNGEPHIPPHRINHAANLQALKDLGVQRILAVHSTGSLRRDLPPGSLAVPDDFLSLYAGPTVFAEGACHIVPALDGELRQAWLAAARQAGEPVYDGGVYWQTAGPRLETRAEIRMMAGHADLVGMTLASEASIAQELGLAYASLCSVDNFAHGVGERPLSVEEIMSCARNNAGRIARIIAAAV